MRNDTLYVTDMDGTLLNTESRVSMVSARILNELAAEGAMVTVATARTPATVVPLLKGVDMRLPAIVMTGAATFDVGRRRYENVRFIERDAVEAALRILDEGGVRPFVYTLRSDQIIHAFHAEELSEAEVPFYSLRRERELKRFHLGCRVRPEDMSRTMLLFCVGEKERFEPIAERVSEAIGYRVMCYNDIFNDNAAFIEVFAPGVSKRSAVEDLAREVGARRVVVFGDNLNDLSMMEAADVAVAVENAYEDVKMRADMVIGTNNEDAVARWIYKDFTGYDWR